ncbi:ribosome hibernation-promoting factor, HPF/YfiA family [Tersicoccus sp. Bi-70]|uniref:ribosome hibernation-promoting factor, HPF/YfiA family n=1 Tax=Tersicoccus sp. Bi-70 TaxID=1897634 RepID=UPI000976C44D|nr:ribosome-associated translation inhibitor RaiA [Tersicoccus sp. Bi-70]OMH35166.1 ribosomal subunit interface protein [Tersicoccus sp. Bi-70]
MDFSIYGRNVTVSDRYREYAEEKIAKIEPLVEKKHRLEAKVTKQPSEVIIELTVLGLKPVIRAEAASEDKFAAFDAAARKLAERLRRARDRKKVHHQGHQRPTAVHEATASLPVVRPDTPLYLQTADDVDGRAADTVPDQQSGDSPVTIRRKVFPAARLTLDDAVDAMEMVGHDFYLFIDEETSTPSVVYRRRGWTYGVISLDEACDENADVQEEELTYRSAGTPA